MSTEDELAAILIRDEGARSDHAAFLAARVLERLQWPVDGGPAKVINGRKGQPEPDMTPADLIGQIRTTFPFAFGGGPIQPPAAAPSTGPKFAPGTRTAQAIAFDAARKAGQSKADDTAPNPWSAATRNLTQQVLLEARDPARAARLKAEAAR